MTISPPKFAITTALVASVMLVNSAHALAATPTAAKAKPPVLTCKTATPSGLSYTVIKPGTGNRPGADAKVKLNYKGVLTSGGSEFDSGQGVEFKVGGVIPGFAQGLQIMQPGGSYRLCIPSKLGYGEAGSGTIPANADLVFEVDLLSFKSPPPKPIIPLAERSCDKTTASGLGYAMTKVGTGKSPTDADMALVDFMTFDAKTGAVMEMTEWQKVPIAQANAIFGEALKLMQVGSSYTFCQSIKQPEQQKAEPEVNIRIDLLDIRQAPSTD